MLVFWRKTQVTQNDTSKQNNYHNNYNRTQLAGICQRKRIKKADPPLPQYLFPSVPSMAMARIWNNENQYWEQKLCGSEQKAIGTNQLTSMGHLNAGNLPDLNALPIQKDFNFESPQNCFWLQNSMRTEALPSNCISGSSFLKYEMKYK